MQSSDHFKKKARILLLHKDENGRGKELCALLRHASYEVNQASCTDAAERLLTSGAYDVILADEYLHDATGLSFLKRARLLKPDTARILLCEDRPFSMVVKAVQQAGISLLLVKPITDDEMLYAVQQVLPAYDEKVFIVTNIAS